MHRNFNWRTALLATSVLAVAAPTTGWAAEAAEAADSTIEEVIVTARKREERLQDVPLAVTAITGQSLERENVVQVADLATKSPSLMVTPGFGSSRAVPNFSIRGLSQQEQTLLSDPSVTVYVGDIVAARAQGLNQALIDIGSVQVLKGPQGTLFGRNTTGGAIIIQPNKPTDEFEGSVAVTAGNFGAFNTEAVLNVPVGDQLRIRLAGGTQKRDGFIHDVLLNNRDVNNVDNWTFRASVDFRPTDAISSLTVFNIFDEDDGGQGAFIKQVNPNGAFNSAPARASRNYPLLQDMLAAQQARDDFHIASGVKMYTKVKTWDLANTSAWQITDGLQVKNIIGVRRVKNENYEDTDGLPIPLLEIERHIRAKQFTEEFQVLGETGPLTWIVGAYYFEERGYDQGLSITGAVDPGPVQPNFVGAYPSWSNTWVEGHNTSYAVFAQGTYKLDSVLKGLSITAGLRGNWDKREAVIKNRTNAACRFTANTDNNPATPEVALPIAACALPVSAKFDEPTYNLSLDYKIDADTLIYVATRHGYRSGGFGARAATEAGLRRTFEPETITDFEVGAKRDWRFGGAFLRTNVALFQADYKDIQRLLTDPNTIPVTTVAVNAAKATIKGAELEFIFRPNDLFQLSGFYSYTDASFDRFITPAGVDLSSSPFARAPKHLYSLTAQVNVPTPESVGEVTVGATYFHSADWFVNDDATGAPPPFQSANHFPSYEYVNLNAEWRGVMGSNFDISAFVNNVTNETIEWPQLQIITSLGFEARTVGPPRMYGVKLRYRF